MDSQLQSKAILCKRSNARTLTCTTSSHTWRWGRLLEQEAVLGGEYSAEQTHTSFPGAIPLLSFKGLQILPEGGVHALRGPSLGVNSSMNIPYHRDMKDR